MINNRITISMIETAINKGIRDIEDNPKRGIRNLVDLAKHFASSPFQNDLLQLMKDMLANLKSPYYNIVSSLINDVNHSTIKTFGINLGYNSWSHGCKVIRSYKNDYDYNIPWTIVFDFDKNKNMKLDKDKIADIINQGKELGIYTYIFFINSVMDYLDILKENPDCAFVLFVPLNILNSDNINEITSYKNTFFAILYEPDIRTEEFENTIELLNYYKSLFGLYSYYGDDNAEYILKNIWIDEIIDLKSSFGFLVESETCSEENASLIKEYVLDSKTNQKYPIFLIDLYNDIAYIDKNISVDPGILRVKDEGDTYYYKSDKCKICNIEDMSLKEILTNNKKNRRYGFLFLFYIFCNFNSNSFNGRFCKLNELFRWNIIIFNQPSSNCNTNCI